MDTVVEGVVVQPIDAPFVQLTAEDSAVLYSATRPTRLTSFSEYETIARLAQDTPGVMTCSTLR